MTAAELKDRTVAFAHACVKRAASLPATDLNRILRNQLMRCATSVAANYRAACLAQSKPAFAAKISVVLEEADESAFWLEFIRDENLLPPEFLAPCLDEAHELTRIFAASRKTSSQSARLGNN